jgi:hypothetical protein
MKTIPVMIIALAATALAATPLRAADDADGKCDMCKCMMKPEDKPKPKMMMMGMDKMKAMEKKMDAEAAELQKLVDDMNASTGDKKIEALSAVVNKMVQNHKAMCKEMKEMKDMKDMKAGDKGGEHKDHAAAPPKEEIQKAEDPHAGHQH